METKSNLKFRLWRERLRGNELLPDTQVRPFRQTQYRKPRVSIATRRVALRKEMPTQPEFQFAFDG